MLINGKVAIEYGLADRPLTQAKAGMFCNCSGLAFLQALKGIAFSANERLLPCAGIWNMLGLEAEQRGGSETLCVAGNGPGQSRSKAKTLKAPVLTSLQRPPNQQHTA